MNQLETHDNVQYYIQTPNQKYGPYPSRAVAEAMVSTLALTEHASIVPIASSGKQVLFG